MAFTPTQTATIAVASAETEIPAFSLPKFDAPELPELPKFEAPELPNMPTFDFDVPDMPELQLPELPKLGLRLPEIKVCVRANGEGV